MKKKTTPADSCKKELAALRKEVAGLKKQMAKLEKAAQKAAKPGRLRATRAVVDSLDVADATGKVVASIDNKGNLFCRTVWASTDKNVRGVFLDGVTFRKVSAASIELIGPTGNTPALEANISGNYGQIHLRDLKSKQQLTLQGSGAPITAYDDKSGTAAITMMSNVASGGQLKLIGTNAGSKATAVLSVSHLTNAGALRLDDAAGNTVGKLP